MPGRPSLRGRPALLPCAVFMAGVAYLGWLQTKPVAEQFYSGDAGLKFLQVSQWLRGGDARWSLHLELPADAWVRDLWKQGYYPLHPPFVVPRDGRQFINYPPFFSWLCAPFFGLMGWPGLYVVPAGAVVALWLTIVAVARLGAMPAGWTALGLATVVFASPLTFYGAMFWEHTLGVALAFPAVARLIMQTDSQPARAWVWSGVLLGLSAWFRPEYMLLAGMMTVAAPLVPRLVGGRRAGLNFAGGIAAGLTGTLVYNVVVSGSLWGFRGEQVGQRDALWMPEQVWHVLTWTGKQFLTLYPTVLVVIVVAVVRAWNRAANSRRDTQLLVMAAVHMLVLTVVFPDTGGTQWGPRYHLLLIPAAALLLVRWAAEDRAAGRRGWGRMTVGLMAIAVLSGAYQNTRYGVADLERAYTQRMSAAVASVKESPWKVVAVNNQRLTMELAAVLGNKQAFMVHRAEDWGPLVAAVLRQGEKGLLLVSVGKPLQARNEMPIDEAFGGGTLVMEPICIGTTVVYELRRVPGGMGG